MTSRKLLGFTSLMTLSFGLMAGCSSDSNPGSAEESSASAEVPQVNACAQFGDYYATPAVTGEILCYDAAGTLTFWINTDGSFGVPTTDPTDTTTTIPVAVSSSSIASLIASSSSVNPFGISSSSITNPFGVSSSSVTNPFGVSSSSVTNPFGISSSSTTSFASSSSMTTVVTSSASGSSNGNTAVISYASSGASITTNNGCVTVNGGETVITCAGDYDFSGSYSGSDAQIRVYSPKTDSGVYLNLRGLTLTNSADAPIYVQMASKTFVVAKSGTTNTLADGSSRSKEYSYVNNSGETVKDTTNAAIYSKDDLTLKGEGSLKVTGNYNNGIQSSNDLRVKNGEINVTAKNNGLKGKGSVQISGGTLTVTTTEGDGIKSDEGEDENTTVTDKGVVVITGGNITITSGDDGIQAWNYVLLADSTSVPVINIKAGSGTPDVTKNESMGGFGGNSWGGNSWGGGGNNCYGPNCQSSSSTTTDGDTTTSNKGIVAGVNITVNAGSITVASVKDALHSNGTANINGGTLSLTGRRGIHADNQITVSGGVMDVPNSYEGLEAPLITMKGGITSIYASDDGWNASDGNDNCSSCQITISNGFHYVRVPSGDTDGIDSNGKISVTGGYVTVENNSTNGETANMFDGSGSVSGGNVLGFAPSSEVSVQSYNVSITANNYYGTSKWACKAVTSRSSMYSNNGTPSQVTNFNGMTAVGFTGTTASCYYAN